MTPPTPMQRIRVAVGDITCPNPSLHIDTIVNAANTSLLGGGGVDGAIHRAAGSQLHAFNRTLHGCATGLVKPSPAFDLESRGIRHILHAVGPTWPFDDERPDVKLSDLLEDVLLASCYVNAMRIACELGSRCVAFPAISTGVDRFPKPRAAKIAIGHVIGHFAQRPAPPLPEAVVFMCFDEDDADVYRNALATADDWMFNRRRV